MVDKRLLRMIKQESELSKIEKACKIVAQTLQLVKENASIGVSTLELDRIAEDFIKSKKGYPAFKGFKSGNLSFPATLCISLDEEVVHGIPTEDRILKEGQIVSVDCGCLLEGYYGDAALSFGIGEISEEKKKLLQIAEESLYDGIAQAIEGKKIYDIAQAVQSKCETNGFSLTRELVGHGIGKSLHEEPAVPNFVPPLLHRNRFPNVKLHENMTICIEPMVHAGRKEVEFLQDGWTVRTKDKSPAAHFEHTVAVGKNKARILTLVD